jgi:hypothetical protein
MAISVIKLKGSWDTGLTVIGWINWYKELYKIDN